MTTSSYNIKKLNNKLDSLIKALNGAKGSGNFGHAGRPGKVGGSGPGNGMSTKSDSILHDTVKQMADIYSTMNKREGYKYSSSEDLVLKQGKFFTPEKRPENIELGSKKECFANASRLALERSDLTYVEGYAMINDRLPLPIAHAWCVDKKGRVIDNTWEKPGVSYFGVPFKTSYLAKKLSETGVYGILSGSVGTSDFLKDGVPSEGIASIKKQKNAVVINGGKGSGNFGHAGRLGKVGGSSMDGSGSKVEFSELLSKDAKEVLGEINENSEGTYFKEINSVLDDFSKLGVDVKKVKFETNDNKLPEKMKKQVTDSTEGMIAAKKNLETVIYLDETKQSEYGLGGENKYQEGKEPKDQPWATNNSPIGILKHELGHLAAYTVFMNSRGRKGTAGPILGGAVNLETHKNFRKIFGENYSLNRLKLSRYGMKDSSEAVAEAFANPNFSSDTKKIYDFYVSELKKKVQNNAVEDDEWLVLCLGFTTEEPLTKKVNQLIRKINKITGKGGNPYHDEKGRFASGPSSSSKGGSKSSIIEKGGMEGGYIVDTLDEFNDEQLSKLAKNPIANLSEKRLKEVASIREKMYGTRDEFNLANQWLLSIVGNGADIMQKAKDLDFDPSKEIKLSRKIIGDKEVTLFRNQEGEFDKKNYKESRWGDIPHSHSSSGNDYTIKGNKNNILIHPEVLYSADINDSYYRNEREYVVDNSKIKDVWRGVKL